MKLVLLSVLAAMLLLFGCAQQPAAPSEQGCITSAGYTWCAEKGKCIREADEKCSPAPIVGNDRDAHGCIGSAGYSWCAVLNKCIRPWEENCTQLAPSPQATCSLTLTPSTIFAGDSTDIGFTVSTKENIKFTYNCGADTLEISTGGLTGGSRLCRFTVPGEQQVWIKADGQVCAQKTLMVRPASEGRRCSVALTEKDAGSLIYKMQVNFTGFAPGENVTWDCGYTHASKAIYGDPTFGMPTYEIISCDFAKLPTTGKNTITVSVGGMECGQIPLN